MAGAWMLGGELALEILVLAKHGKGVREIAREVGVSRNTVRRYLRDAEAARYRARPPRPGKLAPFEGYIAERVAWAAPERLEATVLLRELRERGYAGGYSILKEHLARLRPAAEPEPVARFETAPGEQMQVDWAVIRRGAERLSVFVATLGWSRATYIEFVGDERLETLLACHEHAFLAFGGVLSALTEGLSIGLMIPLFAAIFGQGNEGGRLGEIAGRCRSFGLIGRSV